MIQKMRGRAYSTQCVATRVYPACRSFEKSLITSNGSLGFNTQVTDTAQTGSSSSFSTSTILDSSLLQQYYLVQYSSLVFAFVTYDPNFNLNH